MPPRRRNHGEDLPEGWLVYNPDEDIPNTHVFFNGLLIPYAQHVAMARLGVLNQTGHPPPPPEQGIPKYVLNRLQMAELGTFACNTEENAANWIDSIEHKLSQVECPERYWISEVSLRLKLEASKWADNWQRENRTNPTWTLFKTEFLERFHRPEMDLNIIAVIENLKQTDTVRDYIKVFDEARVRAPVEIDFDHAAMRRLFTKGLKPFVARNMDMKVCVDLQTTFREAEAAEYKSNLTYNPPKKNNDNNGQLSLQKTSRQEQHNKKPYSRPRNQDKGKTANFKQVETQVPDHSKQGKE